MDPKTERDSKRSNQIGETVFNVASLDMIDGRFRDKFLEQHRHLKALIHLC